MAKTRYCFVGFFVVNVDECDLRKGHTMKTPKLTPEELKKVAEIARREDRTMGVVMQRLIREGLKQHEV